MWRVVVADQRSPRDGRIIESIGHYNARTEPSTIVIDRERLQHWIDRGAVPTNTVRKLMRAPNSVGGGNRAEAEAPDEPAPDPGQGPAPDELGLPPDAQPAGDAEALSQEGEPTPAGGAESEAAAEPSAAAEEAVREDDAATGEGGAES